MEWKAAGEIELINGSDSNYRIPVVNVIKAILDKYLHTASIPCPICNAISLRC